jgi:hypothetical protein
MRPMARYAMFGALFGAVGLFGLSALSMISPWVEKIADRMLWPGRYLAEQLFGSSMTDQQVVLLAAMNGLLYALVFVILGTLMFGNARRRSASY